MPPRAVRVRWALTGDLELVGDRRARTWRVHDSRRTFVLKHFGPRSAPDWNYALRASAVLRRLGWPTQELVDEPLVRRDGAWALLRWLPGEPSVDPREHLLRGRLLAELHAAAAALSGMGQRAGFVEGRRVVADPELDRWLRVHERVNPEQGRVLRAARDAAARWFAENSTEDLPAGFIHGDFASWNLLYSNDRLTGVIDFEECHRNLLIADFALSWRGRHDDVIRGYEQVRRLSEGEWAALMPVYHAWLFLGVRDAIETAYRPRARRGTTPLDLGWQVSHLLRTSELVQANVGCAGRARGAGR